jgi:hypothetical protein
VFILQGKDASKLAGDWFQLLMVLLEIKIFRQNLWRKPKHTFHLINISPEYCTVYKIMWKKDGRSRQATNDNVTRRMRFAYTLRIGIS